jgi:acyl CoA:acetate/3-ketoacid CoA transferase alpha subunit
MDKVIGSPDEIVAQIPDGASVAIAGFGLAHRFLSGLMEALVRSSAKDLTLVCNSWGRFGQALSQLIEDRRVAKLITSFSARASEGRSPAEEQIAEGTLAVELVPQGTLVERLRAGGAGLAASTPPPAWAPPSPKGRRSARSTAGSTSSSRRCGSTTPWCGPTGATASGTSSCGAAAGTST